MLPHGLLTACDLGVCKRSPSRRAAQLGWEVRLVGSQSLWKVSLLYWEVWNVSFWSWSLALQWICPEYLSARAPGAPFWLSSRPLAPSTKLHTRMPRTRSQAQAVSSQEPDLLPTERQLPKLSFFLITQCRGTEGDNKVSDKWLFCWCNSRDSSAGLPENWGSRQTAFPPSLPEPGRAPLPPPSSGFIPATSVEPVKWVPDPSFCARTPGAEWSGRWLCCPHPPSGPSPFSWMCLLGSRLSSSRGTVLSYRVPLRARSHLHQGGTKTWPLSPHLGQIWIPLWADLTLKFLSSWADLELCWNSIARSGIFSAEGPRICVCDLLR